MVEINRLNALRRGQTKLCSFLFTILENIIQTTCVTLLYIVRRLRQTWPNQEAVESHNAFILLLYFYLKVVSHLFCGTFSVSNGMKL